MQIALIFNTDSLQSTKRGCEMQDINLNQMSYRFRQQVYLFIQEKKCYHK